MFSISAEKLKSTNDIEPGQKFWTYRWKTGWTLRTCERVENGRIYVKEQGSFPRYFYPIECYKAVPFMGERSTPVCWYAALVLLVAALLFVFG